MSNYCTLTQVKTFLDTDDNADDNLLNDLITRSSRQIDQYCSRTLYGRYETRYYDPTKDVDGYGTLRLDDDLQSVTTVTNGDGTAVAASNYILEPPNELPAYALTLKASASISWTYSGSPENSISINGTWGFVAGTVPPEPIRQAAIELALWHYRRRGAPFEIVGLPDASFQAVPAGMPKAIVEILNQYRPIRVNAVGYRRRRNRFSYVRGY